MSCPSSDVAAILFLSFISHCCIQCSSIFSFSKSRPFGVPCTALPISGPLHSVGMTWWINSPRKMGPSQPWVCFLGCRRHPTTRFRSPYRFSSAPDSFHHSLFIRDFLMLHYGVQHFSVSFQISYTGLHPFCSGGPPAWGLGMGPITPHSRKQACYKHYKEPRAWPDSLDK
jgi:hypothetical protein